MSTTSPDRTETGTVRYVRVPDPVPGQCDCGRGHEGGRVSEEAGDLENLLDHGTGKPAVRFAVCRLYRVGKDVWTRRNS